MKPIVLPVAMTTILLLWSGYCHTQSPAPADAVKLNLSLEDSPSTTGFARVYEIKSEAQFVPGNLGDAYLGDIVLETDKLRAVIARPGKPEMGLVRGGTLMDVTSGAGAVDYFGSFNTTTDPTSTGSVAIYTKVRDIKRSDQTTASITLDGYVGEIQSSPPSPSEKISLQTSFSAARNSNRITVTTTFTNETSRTAWLRPADLIDWGEARVFAEGSGYASTSSTTNFVVGAVDNSGLAYHTSGTAPMEGIHSGRDSLILATGTSKALDNEIRSLRSITNKKGSRLPPEFDAIGASLTPGPGMIMYPGTESRYVMEAFGTPRNEPIYVPRGSLQFKDGKPTVSLERLKTSALFTKPASNLDSFIELSPGNEYEFTRFLTCSNANWAKPARDAYRGKGISTGILAGAVVEDGTATRISDAIVRISGGPTWSGEGPAPAIMQTVSREDGTFTAHVPPGKYMVEADALGRRMSGIATPIIEVKMGNSPAIAALTMTPESRLRVAISEAETPTSSPLPVKLTLISKPPFATQNYGFTSDVTNGIHNTRYLPYGADIFPVTPGRYRLVVSRGIEYDILEHDIELAPGQEITVTGSLPHVMRGLLPPMVSMDAGLVSSASGSGYATAESRAIQAACEGVQIIVSGDYDQATDLQKAIDSKRLTQWVKAFTGQRFLLHKDDLSADVFVYPLTNDTISSLSAALFQIRDLPPDVALADLKQQFPDLIFEISRPAHPEAGYLNAFPMEKANRNFVDNAMPPPDFDAIQLLEGKRLGQYPETYPSYMALQLGRLGQEALQKGTPLSAAGSSFSRLTSGQEVGYPRTYVYLTKSTPLAEITERHITSAVREQNFLVTNGPLILFEALDYQTREFSVKPGESVDLRTTDICRIRVRVLAAPWITLSGVTTKENGVHGNTVMISKASEEVRRYPGISDSLGSNIYSREIKSDTILEAMAYSERRSLEPVVPDALEDFGGPVYPFAWSGPIFVDRDGDGKILINGN